MKPPVRSRKRVAERENPSKKKPAKRANAQKTPRKSPARSGKESAKGIPKSVLEWEKRQGLRATILIHPCKLTDGLEWLVNQFIIWAFDNIPCAYVDFCDPKDKENLRAAMEELRFTACFVSFEADEGIDMEKPVLRVVTAGDIEDRIYPGQGQRK